MSLSGPNHSAPISTASVSLRIVHDDEDNYKRDEHPLMEAAAEALMIPADAALLPDHLASPAAGCGDSTHENQVRKSSTRKPIVMVDARGQERTFGSALGALTRKFVDVIQTSQSGSVDMNETATFLQVPKRRIYDITNVLEGVGILEKRSKNIVAWKGSEAILGSFLDADVKEQMEDLRRVLQTCFNEESMIDHWTSVLQKKSPATPNALSCSDIVEAFYYPVGESLSLLSKDELVDELGKPKQSLLVIHAPHDSLVQIPSPEYDGQSSRQLFVGTKDAVKLDSRFAAATGKRRRLSNDAVMEFKTTHRCADSKIEVFALSTYFDEHYGKIASSVHMRALSNDVRERSTSWDLAESLANDEGVSDFIVTGEEEAV